MEWIQVLTILGSTAGLLIWFRAESRSDYRHTDAMINAIKDDVKDFHGRLCAIEERRTTKKRK